jgi:drug/metabolite transporter (DMT)-like permease
MPALLALMSSIMWGGADFLGGLTSRRLPSLAVYGLSQIAGLVVLMVVATTRGGWGADPGYWPWSIASGLLGIVAMVTFYRALALGPMGIVAPVTALSVVVPVGFGLVRGEVPSGMQTLGILAAIAGILLASGPELSSPASSRPLILAGLAALAFGCFYVAMAEGSRVDPLMTITGMRITAVAVFAVILVKVRTLGGAGRADIVPLAAIGILDASAALLFAYATTMALLATTSVLGSLYPVVTAVLAAVVLRERLRAVQYVGVVIALSGVVMISAG